MGNEKAIKELTEKIQTLVTSKFGGDWYRAYTDYELELVALLP